ncbi:gamma-glutamylcyclotransferase [Roseibacterium beibuensis]|uniref:glutathione-specific gamma-glutamylcyclotransferase n=1 Tax=[Roseibacterium] beibuensis TaxID=1193142 RepID=A0ABP9KTA3_9RHOB|nr:gamma-glutamylcyclotransferase [Roseibacterium beibuensis]MCS6622244.1 gamma-glutamylcyclotransferase [Roseibacterium beibuensis]
MTTEMDGDLWVFGYGSLLWNPGFPVAEAQVARLHHWHRSFCMSSIHHRGTVENPGLVLALDAAEGAHCDGLAFRVEARYAAQTIDYLRDRELISSAYVETRQEVELHGDRTRLADVLTYVIDAAHDQYRGSLSLEDQAQIIAGATGGRGPNDEYLFNTAAHLRELGLADADLDWLVERVQALKTA